MPSHPPAAGRGVRGLSRPRAPVRVDVAIPVGWGPLGSKGPAEIATGLSRGATEASSEPTRMLLFKLGNRPIRKSRLSRRPMDATASPRVPDESLSFAHGIVGFAEGLGRWRGDSGIGRRPRWKTGESSAGSGVRMVARRSELDPGRSTRPSEKGEPTDRIRGLLGDSREWNPLLDSDQMMERVLIPRRRGRRGWGRRWGRHRLCRRALSFAPGPSDGEG